MDLGRGCAGAGRGANGVRSRRNAGSLAAGLPLRPAREGGRDRSAARRARFAARSSACSVRTSRSRSVSSSPRPASAPSAWCRRCRRSRARASSRRARRRSTDRRAVAFGSPSRFDDRSVEGTPCMRRPLRGSSRAMEACADEGETATRPRCAARGRRRPSHAVGARHSRPGSRPARATLPEAFGSVPVVPVEHLAPESTGQLDDRFRASLQVQPPGWLGLTPSVHGHRDQVGSVFVVADGDAPRLAAAPAGRRESQGAPFPRPGGHRPRRLRLARTINRCTCQKLTTNQRGGRRAFSRPCVSGLQRGVGRPEANSSTASPPSRDLSPGGQPDDGEGRGSPNSRFVVGAARRGPPRGAGRRRQAQVLVGRRHGVEPVELGRVGAGVPRLVRAELLGDAPSGATSTVHALATRRRPARRTRSGAGRSTTRSGPGPPSPRPRR